MGGRGLFGEFRRFGLRGRPIPFLTGLRGRTIPVLAGLARRGLRGRETEFRAGLLRRGELLALLGII